MLKKWFSKKDDSDSATPGAKSKDYIDVKPEPVKSSDSDAKAVEVKQRRRLFGPSKAEQEAQREQQAIRDQQIESLRSGYRELVDMMRSVRDHMDRQVDNQQQLLEVMKELPGAMKSLKDVSRAADQQTQIIGMIQKQMDANTARDEKFVATLDRFNGSLDHLDKATQNSANTISALAEKNRENEETLRDMLRRSEKRLVTFIGVLVGMTLTVLIVGILLGYMSREEAVGPLPQGVLESPAGPAFHAGITALNAEDEGGKDAVADTDPAPEGPDAEVPTLEDRPGPESGDPELNGQAQSPAP